MKAPPIASPILVPTFLEQAHYFIPDSAEEVRYASEDALYAFPDLAEALFYLFAVAGKYADYDVEHSAEDLGRLRSSMLGDVIPIR